MARLPTLSCFTSKAPKSVSAIDRADRISAPPAATAAPTGSQGPLQGSLLLVSVFAAQTAFFGFVALHRFIDGDEGFYLLASRLVLMHKRPYLDFIYEQAPLLPYVYGLWMKVFTVSWVAARLLSALLASLLGTLLYADVLRQTRSWIAGFAALIMYSGSTLIFGFFPVAKTFSLAGLLLFVAYITVSRDSAISSRWLLAASGLFFALSVETRSYLLVLFPLFAYWIIRGSEPKERWKPITRFVAGCVLGFIPSLFFFVSSPELFYFNNLGYHAVRWNSSLIGMWQQKVVTVLQLFLGGAETNGIQTSILFLISLGLISAVAKPRWAPRFAFQVAIVIALVSLLPTPTWVQYFSLCMPFLLLASICAAAELVAGMESRQARMVALVACGVVFAIYLAPAFHDFRRYLTTGEGVPGVKAAENPDDWKMQTIVEVSQAIDQIASPGEYVASFWSGYLVQSKAKPFPGLEADYGWPLSGALTAEQMSKYHVLSIDEIEKNFALHRPRVAVLRDHVKVIKGGIPLRNMYAVEDAFRASLLANGYNAVRSIGGVSIYVWSPKQ